MHSLVPSFLPSFLYLQLDVCSHKIWCTHHLQMSLQLPGESISFTNISDRGREFQRSWQTRCSSSRYFQTAVKMVICSYKYVCRHYVISDTATIIDVASAGMGRVRASRHRTGFIRCWHHPRKTPWLPMTFPDRKELVVEWKNERGSFWSSTRMAAMRKRCRDMPRVSLMWPSSCEFSIAADSLCVFFLLVQGCDEKLKTIEANWEKSNK